MKINSEVTRNLYSLYFVQSKKIRQKKATESGIYMQAEEIQRQMLKRIGTSNHMGKIGFFEQIAKKT